MSSFHVLLYTTFPDKFCMSNDTLVPSDQRRKRRQPRSKKSCQKNEKQYTGRTHFQMTVQHIRPFQNVMGNTLRQPKVITRRIFINVICCSFQITKNF